MRAMDSLSAGRAQALYGWLLRHPPDQPLPRAAEIATAAGLPDAGIVCNMFDRLSSGPQRVIYHVHGTRSRYRGHRAVRLLLTGRVLATDGCPPALIADLMAIRRAVRTAHIAAAAP